MTERYLEEFEAGQTFGSGRIRIDAERIVQTRSIEPTVNQKGLLQCAQ